ncbi:DUF1800 domain-containing protein [Nocardioides sp. URHA0020]|uniref:DUF1800 domain-containing protein n=1 Tax=Nocardioides sp. URHA0020 TaxID=1380392 RepID=UPI000687E7F8|nr:DUF1800 domain-containing protein [Nocardioides sp. URHA0020]
MTTDAPTRRHALRLAGGATAAAGTLATGAASPAEAARLTYGPGRYSRTRLLSVQQRHLANRFSYGITPRLATEIRSAGGHLAWFDRQLATAYDGSADRLCDWWPDLHRSAVELWTRTNAGGRGGWEVMWDYGNRTMMRRMVSPRQVLEVMTEFWENHFHVALTSDNIYTFRADYGEVVRRHALGRFEDLLKAAVLHPAMLMFLGNATSTKAHPNENLGRELLELHTVGIGSYGEDDVKSSARILTGHRVDLYRTWAASYVPSDHWTGPVRVMDFTHDNAAADGREVSDAYLSYLAHHPATAHRIATKLVKAFVSDSVPAGLVDRLATVYLRNDTEIVPVLKALVRTPEFKSAVDKKVRDGDEDVLATYRLLGVGVKRPRTEVSAANQVYWQTAMLGLAPLTWPRPDGQPVDNASWSSPTRALASMSFHWDVINGWWPGDAVTFPRPRSWMPRARPMQFRTLVDHMSRRLLHRPSTAALLKACCEAAELRPTTRIGRGSALFTTAWPRVVATILDSPAFYQR